MIRRVLAIVFLSGLLLSAAMWGVSYHGLSYSWIRLPRRTSFIFLNGFVQLHSLEVPSTPNTSPSIYQLRSSWYRGTAIQGIAKQQSISLWKHWRPLRRSGKLPTGHLTITVVPLWNLTLLFFILFAVSYPESHRRRKRRKRGLCLKCGYDLRGSKDRCPECGEDSRKT